jgi:hypothetical protein
MECSLFRHNIISSLSSLSCVILTMVEFHLSFTWINHVSTLVNTLHERGLGRPTPTLVPCWSLNPCLQGTSVGPGLPQPTRVRERERERLHLDYNSEPICKPVTCLCFINRGI